MTNLVTTPDKMASLIKNLKYSQRKPNYIKQITMTPYIRNMIQIMFDDYGCVGLKGCGGEVMDYAFKMFSRQWNHETPDGKKGWWITFQDDPIIYIPGKGGLIFGVLIETIISHADFVEEKARVLKVDLPPIFDKKDSDLWKVKRSIYDKKQEIYDHESMFSVLYEHYYDIKKELDKSKKTDDIEIWTMELEKKQQEIYDHEDMFGVLYDDLCQMKILKYVAEQEDVANGHVYERK